MSARGNARSGSAKAVIIVKAVPHVGVKHGETVCCAGIDPYRNWLRLYPVCFRSLDDAKKFGRWDLIEFRWRLPTDDQRIESRRVDQDSIKIVGSLKKSERSAFLAPLVVTGLDAERKLGHSLALLKAQILAFNYEKRSDEDLSKERDKFKRLSDQPSLFNSKPLIPYSPCPYSFKYEYQTDDGRREGTCQDWEIEATFLNWRRAHDEAWALKEMVRVFGAEYPKKGMLLAMGTHSRYPDRWLINGIVRCDGCNQGALF